MGRESKQPLAAVITAAGLSSRMGCFKPMLQINGVSMIRRIVQNLSAAGANPIVVITGYREAQIRQELSDQGVILIHNPDYAASHMFDSLCLGLRAVCGQCSSVLVTPADVPSVKAETITELLSVEAPFVCPTYRGERGHPVILSGEIIPALLAYHGKNGLTGAIRHLQIETICVDTDDEGILIDADTPEDFAQILEIEERRSENHLSDEACPASV